MVALIRRQWLIDDSISYFDGIFGIIIITNMQQAGFGDSL